ncbi:hypothetical protein Y032_0242g3436 [Ancylostoma ceylanicum]|uniref:Uncharacterized protein n=1 Tax=Ancylostoma ceylanicum TaxID=53326 RepID=A0A016SEM4_9BILA|nr:hypothetical protein Y032_0242g3436 [Ancylostoma ceylanicum]
MPLIVRNCFVLLLRFLRRPHVADAYHYSRNTVHNRFADVLLRGCEQLSAKESALNQDEQECIGDQSWACELLRSQTENYIWEGSPRCMVIVFGYTQKFSSLGM